MQTSHIVTTYFMTLRKLSIVSIVSSIFLSVKIVSIISILGKIR